jgi:hypothetical protein
VPVIPTEDNYCDWLVGGVKRYFDDRGLRAWSFSIGQVKENEFPFDRAFAVGNKVMGFQVKRPSSTGPQWTWEIDFGSIQHVKVAKTKWILYALPDFADFDRQDVALHHFMFAWGDRVDASFRMAGNYMRWGPVADNP